MPLRHHISGPCGSGIIALYDPEIAVSNQPYNYTTIMFLIQCKTALHSGKTAPLFGLVVDTLLTVEEEMYPRR